MTFLQRFLEGENWKACGCHKLPLSASNQHLLAHLVTPQGQKFLTRRRHALLVSFFLLPDQGHDSLAHRGSSVKCGHEAGKEHLCLTLYFPVQSSLPTGAKYCFSQPPTKISIWAGRLILHLVPQMSSAWATRLLSACVPPAAFSPGACHFFLLAPPSGPG